MTKPQLAILCGAVFMLPTALVIAMNFNMVAVEDRQLGTLLYFSQDT